MREGIGARLRLSREQAGLSQAQVARLMHMHRPTVSEIEAGRRKVSAEEVSALAKLYDVSISWLVNGTSTLESEDSDRILLAARQLSRLKPQDIDTVIALLRTLRKAGDNIR